MTICRARGSARRAVSTTPGKDCPIVLLRVLPMLAVAYPEQRARRRHGISLPGSRELYHDSRNNRKLRHLLLWQMPSPMGRRIYQWTRQMSDMSKLQHHRTHGTETLAEVVTGVALSPGCHVRPELHAPYPLSLLKIAPPELNASQNRVFGCLPRGILRKLLYRPFAIHRPWRRKDWHKRDGSTSIACGPRRT